MKVTAEPVIVCMLKVDDMDIEELFATVMCTTFTLRNELPMPFPRIVDGIGITTIKILKKLEEKGILTEASVKQKADKLMKEALQDAKQAQRESGIDELAEELTSEIEKVMQKKEEEQEKAKSN